MSSKVGSIGLSKHEKMIKYHVHIRARLFKGLIAYPVDNYNIINMISQYRLSIIYPIFCILKTFYL